MYSFFGTHYFKSNNPKYFKNFTTSMFTMFQVFTGDGWSDVSRTLFHDAEQIDFGRRQSRATFSASAEEEKLRIKGCLDPLTKT
jgi:hypothetical protein